MSVEREWHGQHEERELAPSLLRRREPGLRTDVFSLKLLFSFFSLSAFRKDFSSFEKRFFFVRENDNVLLTKLQINVSYSSRSNIKRTHEHEGKVRIYLSPGPA